MKRLVVVPSNGSPKQEPLAPKPKNWLTDSEARAKLLQESIAAGKWKLREVRDPADDARLFGLADRLQASVDDLMEMTGPELLRFVAKRLEERRRARMRLPVEVSDAGTHRNHGQS